MEAIICPGAQHIYAVALIGPAGEFRILSEHDCPASAIAARNAANRAAEDAVKALRLVLA
ncbi:hypothetical protein [Brevundimonas sp.]|uniref:hypothetical protein n=1 Tax=Brevundimonas sp. TaxID=1871086 RepID=UPI00391A41D3